MIKLVIFLDFDGVFHPLIDGKKFQDLPEFQKIIEKYNNHFNFNIVISSSWKDKYNLEELKKFLPNTISQYVIDTTPSFPNQDGSRYQESQEWLTKNPDWEYWLAIDDDHYAWNKHENLIWCHDKFKAREVQIFEEKLNTIISLEKKIKIRQKI